MSHTIKLILVIISGQLLTSCLDMSNNKVENLSIDTDFISVEINDEYQLSVPKYMKKAKDLNEEASLQYQNIFKEAYTVVIDEPKDDFISYFRELGEYNDSISLVKNYSNIQLSYFSERLDISSKSEGKSMKINGLDAELAEITGKAEGVIYPISYYLGFVEGKEKVYMIMTWTLEDRMTKYKPTFKKVIESFALLENQKTNAAEN